MTTLELRDWHARQQGWVCHDDGPRWFWAKPNSATGLDYYDHPIPATIDAANACFPERWTWTRYLCFAHGRVWVAHPDGTTDQLVRTYDTDDEIHDRLALARLCLIAQGAKP